MDPDLTVVDGLVLTAIGALFEEGGGLDAISFGFGELTVLCKVVRDTDSLHIAVQESSVQAGQPPSELEDLVGAVLVFAWPMVNSSGFADGLQIQFAFTATADRDRVVQLMVAASSISVARVEWARLKQPDAGRAREEDV